MATRGTSLSCGADRSRNVARGAEAESTIRARTGAKAGERRPRCGLRLRPAAAAAATKGAIRVDAPESRSYAFSPGCRHGRHPGRHPRRIAVIGSELAFLAL